MKNYKKDLNELTNLLKWQINMGAHAMIEKKNNVCVLTFPGAFNFSAINNFAASKATGEILVLLNNDIEVINECMENSISTTKYDYFNLLSMLDDFELNNTVFTSVSNYDYGLPGSGLAIWHIDESNLENLNDNASMINRIQFIFNPAI